jgi:hypothetical protein
MLSRVPSIKSPKRQRAERGSKVEGNHQCKVLLDYNEQGKGFIHFFEPAGESVKASVELERSRHRSIPTSRRRMRVLIICESRTPPFRLSKSEA